MTYERAVAQIVDKDGRINTITETVDQPEFVHWRMEEPDAPA
ncbi:hypothetical protein PP483_gp75 [Gordonia phage Bunnybear]|uniref:Uncharacterized protein n=1 Tax=Gordonia phage Bunnybear TaxID=2762398 RepID=A0A7G8LLK9_9CAUD|nr:hypothetical protein PP483_gp75 [Gordonia phage Bunnybear]QNJ58131.1 hypothetical protein SEA_BUNNYBEAR_75 [Gordonia phage Bunnybear]